MKINRIVALVGLMLLGGIGHSRGMEFTKPLEEMARSEAYALLGVDEGANADEIKAAFKKLALLYHPDKNPDNDAEENFKRVVRAYAIITGKEKAYQPSLEAANQFFCEIFKNDQNLNKQIQEMFPQDSPMHQFFAGASTQKLFDNFFGTDQNGEEELVTIKTTDGFVKVPKADEENVRKIYNEKKRVQLKNTIFKWSVGLGFVGIGFGTCMWIYHPAKVIALKDSFVVPGLVKISNFVKNLYTKKA